MSAFFAGLLSGFITFLVMFLLRMLRDPAFDSSNIFNAMRVLAHVLLHPNSFRRMYYATELEANDPLGGPVQFSDGKIHWLKKPFWYINKDEFSEVVKTRGPNEQNKVD